MKKRMQTLAKKRLIDFLSDRKLRLTSQRDFILKHFLDTEGQLTAEELYELLKKRDETIGHATVYRTLRLFVNAGIARELHLGDGSVRYEADIEGIRKGYLVCSECGKRVEFSDDEMDSLGKRLSKEHGFSIDNRSVVFFGICPDCQQNGMR
ncbi:Fur family transcriptional regulator [Limisalsivibrio acetivorans]|uniref:Fur family transcriptional regulator n=1 Tax=Limisalsivibrio acetivorans TaxID=1304888 RepID=UPI0003B4FBBE|nr:transcriptional repressor [Limisalsivibrio acetivorans]